jgi:hypothetical protein
MPNGLYHLCRLFADDTKLIGIIRNYYDRINFQLDLDALANWSLTWRMEFNIDKCKIMEIAGRTERVDKQMNRAFTEEPESLQSKTCFTLTGVDGCRHTLTETTEERDLGIYVTNDLKWNRQIDHVCAQASRVMGTLKRTFTYWNSSNFRQLFVTYVRPHLEYCSQVWHLTKVKDIQTVERIQRSATKTVPELSGLSYEERLHKLNLLSLQSRRVRGDLIQQFKFTSGLNKIEWTCHKQQLAVSGPSTGTRNSEHRITREHTKNSKRHEFFTNRIAPIWNRLDERTKSSATVNQFKNRLDSDVKNNIITCKYQITY